MITLGARRNNPLVWIFPLAGIVGSGVQTPGFMGHGKGYIFKSLSGRTGLARVVWMPRELKGRLGDDHAELYPGPGGRFVHKIADEAVGATVEKSFLLKEKGHPALKMKPLI